ncbi:Protease inhibitor precursor [compost metagenome]
MKKTLPVLLSTVMLSGMISLSAAAAPASISVKVDQQTLDLKGHAPVQDHGSILVPLRPVFEKLGLQVVFDAKSGSITGTKDGLLIKLQLGSKKASLNGVARTLTSAPKMIDGTVYVPLRFVGEAAGGSVTWDAKQGLVSILPGSQNSVQVDGEKEITAFFKQYEDYSNKEDYDGIMSLIASDSPLASIGPQIKKQMATYDQSLSVDKLDIVKLGADEATVQTVESCHTTDGPFLPDETAEYVYQLKKAGGSWKISSLQITGVKYQLTQDELNAAPAVPQGDADAIMTVIQNNFKNSNAENLDAVLADVDPDSPAYEMSKESYSQVFKLYDLSYTLDSAKIIKYSADEAVVYAAQTTKKVKGPDFQDNRSTSVTVLHKLQDGAWKIEVTYLLTAEKL